MEEYMYYDDEFDLADEISNLAIDGIEVSVVAHYDKIEKLLKALISYQEYKLEHIELCDEEYNNYDDSYLLEISKDLGIWVYPIYSNERYLISETDMLFVHEPTGMEVYDNIEYSEIIHFKFEDEFEETSCDCKDCTEKCILADDTEELDDDTHGFTISGSDEKGTWSHSFYSTDRELVKEMLKIWK